MNGRVRRPAFRKCGVPALLPLILICAASLVSCGSGRDWVTFRGDQGKGYTQTSIRPPLAVKWKLKLQESTEPAYAFNNPVVIGDTIYFGSTDGNVYALDIESGYMRWVFKTKGAINSVPVADDERLYIGSNDGKLYAINRESGDLAWDFQADNTIQSTIIKHENSVLFVSDGGFVYSLDPRTGGQLYTIPNPVWHYFTFQVYDKGIYFAPGPVTQPHSMGVWDIDLKNYLWILDTEILDAVWYSFPALSDRYVYFSTADPYLDMWEFEYYCYERKTGALVWKFFDYSDWAFAWDLDTTELFNEDLKLLDYLAPSIWTPKIGRNLIVYTSGDSVVRAFNAKTGKVAWRKKLDAQTTSAPTAAGKFLYFGIDVSYGNPKPRLVCLSMKKGKEMWNLELDGKILSAPVIAQNWIIFGTDEHYFYVLEELF